MEAVHKWYQDGWGKDEEKDVTCEEVGAPQRQLDDLDDVFARRLRHGVVAQAAAVPLAGPPRAVRLVVLELAGQEDGDENLVHRALYVDDANQAEHRVRDVPELQEPLKSVLVERHHNMYWEDIPGTQRMQPCR